MKVWEPRGHLSFLLEEAASREAALWRGYVPKKPSSQGADISPGQRDEAVRWLTELHRRLQLYPETLALAVSIVDRFLASVKARPKYLRCIAIACFFLAAKTSEEDERLPSLRQLAVTSGCGCSPAEVLRMERIVLDKLSWDLRGATALDFLHIFHAMAMSGRSGLSGAALGLSRSQHLTLLTRQLYRCLADHTLLQLRGSAVALALLTLELETCRPDWLPLTFDLLRQTQLTSSELVWSRELVARSLSAPSAVYIYQPRSPAAGREGSPRPLSAAPAPSPLKPLSHRNPPQKLAVRCKSSTKRKVEERAEDDVYDDIKRLYNEDGADAVPPVQGGGPSPCPPLQPAEAS